MARSKKTAPEPTEPTTTAPAVVTEVTRTIDVNPEDRAWAVWENREVLPRPEPAPFNFEECRKRLLKLKKNAYGYLTWEKADLPAVLSRQEAHFWLLALTTDQEKPSPSDVADAIKEKAVTGEITVEKIVNRIKGAKQYHAGGGIRVLLNLVECAELLELFRNEKVVGEAWDVGSFAVNEFGRCVLPYLSEQEAEELRDQIRPLIAPANWPTTGARPPLAFFLAPWLRMPDELLAILQTVPDGYYGQNDWIGMYHEPQRLAFGLGTPPLVEVETRRLKIPLRNPVWLRVWLALTEFDGLDYARDQILNETHRESCERLIAEFARVRAPAVAPHMLELKLSAKSPGPAREWLDQQVGNAIAGLVPIAAERGKLAEAAVEYLREAKRKGHESLIRAAVATAGADVEEAVRKSVLDHTEKVYPLLTDEATPADLKDALAAKAKKGLLPSWAVASSLPPIVVAEHRLTDEQTTLVLEALRRSAFDAVDPLVTAVKKHADPASLDAFAWKLFQLWQGDGYPSKEKWGMGAIGHFGGDSSAMKLTPLLRAWPGESQHARAVFGLECLRALGSDTALMQLNGISQKLKFKGLKQKAAEAMEAIAKGKGLTRQQLEDRVVPDCDLDERGQRVFDFGTRRFRFVLGPDMKPMVKDADGKVKTDLPKPGQRDDAAKSAEAIAAWKLMKKQVKEVASAQSARLEQAMVTGRRWPVADFETLLVKHPLMINLVRLVLWGGYDKAGKLSATFRVTEDQTYADASDAAFLPKGIETIGVVHPLHLTDEEKAAWGEVFSDYEIVPPFPQLGRGIHRLEKNELTGTELTRYEGVSLPAPTLVFGLEKLGWTRGAGMDNGEFDEHSKQFPGANVTAVVHYEGGVGFGYIDPNSSLSLGKCYFVAGMRPPSGFVWKETAVDLSKVDPVAVSEVLSDLGALAAKTK